MKRISGLLTTLFITCLCMGQSPEFLNYQGIARDANGDPLLNQSISIGIVISKSSAAGPTQYVETHSETTDANGLFSLMIGNGVVNVAFGTFDEIDWGSDAHFLSVFMDPTGGGSFNLVGSQQLVSVPYALNAKTAETVTGLALPDPSLPIPIAHQGDTLFVAPSDAGTNVTQAVGASFCSSLVSGGYNDWRLPTLAELNAMYKQSYLVVGIDESTGAKYWSSDFDADGNAISRRMDYGAPDPDDPTVATGHNARCVRQNP